MPNLLKSLIELGGDIANTQVANSGGTIFWRPNYEAPENEGYNCKYLFEY
jgi:hypothetical protein